MTNLGIEPGELRFVGAPTGDYKTVYCLSLAKKIAEKGGKVIYYSFEESAVNLQNKLNKSGFRLASGKIIFRTLVTYDMTSLRKQIQLDVTLMKGLKLIILDGCFFGTNDYRSNKSFFDDVRGFLIEYMVACVFTTAVNNNNMTEPVSATDIRFGLGAMNVCDTVYGIKSVKNRKKLSLLQRFLNIFRSKAKKRNGITEKGIYLSVLKNRFDVSNIACKLNINTDKLEVDIEKSS